jgi:hypothetical protein
MQRQMSCKFLAKTFGRIHTRRVARDDDGQRAKPHQYLSSNKEQRETNKRKKERKSTIMESRATETPSAWAVAFGASVVAGLAGYFLGAASSIGVFGSTSTGKLSPKNNDDKDSQIENDSDDSEDDQEFDKFENHYTEECKLVLVVRTDLGMTKGTYLDFFIFFILVNASLLGKMTVIHQFFSPRVKTKKK